MKMKENMSYLYVLTGGAMWGFIGPLVKIMGGMGASSSLICFLRMGFAFLLLFSFVMWKQGPEVLKISGKQLLVCAMLGIFSHAMMNICYSNAIVHLGITVSAVLLYIAPLFTAIISAVAFSEKITFQKAVALTINVLGCILASTGGQLDLKSLSILGIVCGVGAGLCYSTTAVFSRLGGSKNSPVTMSVYSYFFAALFLGITQRPWQEAAFFDTRVLGVGLIYALVPTIIAYLLYYKGVSMIQETSRVPVIASVEMIMAAILGMVIFRESLNIVHMAGIACVLMSIFIMNTRFRRGRTQAVAFRRLRAANR